jgi:hypothetical protein
MALTAGKSSVFQFGLICSQGFLSAAVRRIENPATSGSRDGQPVDGRIE